MQDNEPQRLTYDEWIDIASNRSNHVYPAFKYQHEENQKMIDWLNDIIPVFDTMPVHPSQNMQLVLTLIMGERALLIQDNDNMLDFNVRYRKVIERIEVDEALEN